MTVDYLFAALHQLYIRKGICVSPMAMNYPALHSGNTLPSQHSLDVIQQMCREPGLTLQRQLITCPMHT
jgi:hypothetical protein